MATHSSILAWRITVFSTLETLVYNLQTVVCPSQAILQIHLDQLFSLLLFCTAISSLCVSSAGKWERFN